MYASFAVVYLANYYRILLRINALIADRTLLIATKLRYIWSIRATELAAIGKAVAMSLSSTI